MRIHLSQLIVLTAFSLLSCSASRRVSEKELRSADSDIELLSVRQKDKTALDFSQDILGYAILRDSVIFREKRGSSLEIIPIETVDLSTAYRRRTTGEEILDIALLSSAGAIVLLLLLTQVQFPGW